jgi:hypothetical protein
MKINTKYILPIIAALMLLMTFKRLFFNPVNKTPELLSPPAATDFVKRISGIGIVEPKSENISISPNVPGVVEKVLVTSGQHVKAGDTLFVIDQSLLKAQIKTAKIELALAQENLKFYTKAKKAVSKEELTQITYSAKKAASKLQELETNLELLKVKAPIDSKVLYVDVRVGEYAPAAILTNPLLVLGDDSVMHVRVEIDETDVQRFKNKVKAVGSLRSSGQKTVDLTFVRSENLIKAKRSLVNDGTERVDTRVLEVIYSFPNDQLNAISGQQMDVFIELQNQQE